MSDIALLFILVLAAISGTYVYVLITTLGPALERAQLTSNSTPSAQTVQVITVYTVKYIVVEAIQPASAYTGKTVYLQNEVR